MIRAKHILWYCILGGLSLFAYIGIKVIPFKSIINRVTNTEKIDRSKLSLSKRQEERLFRVQEILEHLSDRVPWRVLCFEQALVALWIAKILKIHMNVYFGIKQEEGRLLAHAWTEAGTRIFTGGKGRQDFMPVLVRGYEPVLKERI